ncbi:uncharacterized protein LOC117110299 isoform X2 [Anneissia japonica]|uniref:uncharacterized protein LOC117110299 isoform X2 n=1 Tax=Anneissia japonica TaxID=1529436 RepID=UPI0014255D19|nr:uncharacterized protein LOC117110299 isoform X2 [Anneissia japonica]
MEGVQVGSGSVYTFGGGLNGQLGHGQDVRYLQNPRLLHRDHFNGCRISLIQCGEQYSAALTENGQLYMWGKNSQVIPLKDESKSSLYVPERVDIGEKRLRLLACGSWHAIAVTGVPECHGWPEEFSESEVDDISDTETMSSSYSRESTQSEMQTIFKQDDECGQDLIPAPKTNLGRQKTVLSLAEFYAPTPGPVPPLLRSIPHSCESPNQNFKKSEDSEEETVFLNAGDILEYQSARHSVMIDNTSCSDMVESIIIDKPDNLEECTNVDVLKSNRPSPRQLRKPVLRPKPPLMSRSQTFAETVSNREVKQSPVHVSRSGVVDFNYVDSFRSSKKAAKKPELGLAMVHLQGNAKGDVISLRNHPAMHQPPKLTKAHTIYGRYKMSQRAGSHGVKKNSPIFDRQKFTSDPKPSQQVKKASQSGSFFELSPQASRTGKAFMPRKPLSLTRKPVFSSASSWKSRTKPGTWVVGEAVRKKEDKN